jgi:excisionase family DNA binding protein
MRTRADHLEKQLTDWLTTDEAGKLLNTTKRHASLLARTGRLKGATQRGGVWFIPRASVPAYIKELRSEGGPNSKRARPADKGAK